MGRYEMRERESVARVRGLLSAVLLEEATLEVWRVHEQSAFCCFASASDTADL